jgi:hypothetical protein
VTCTLNLTATGAVTLGKLKPVLEQLGGALDALHVALGHQRKDATEATHFVAPDVEETANTNNMDTI